MTIINLHLAMLNKETVGLWLIFSLNFWELNLFRAIQRHFLFRKS